MSGIGPAEAAGRAVCVLALLDAIQICALKERELATLGIDLEAVAGRLQESFGREAYWQATERVRNRPAQGATHRPMSVPPPFVCARVFNIAAHEAIARDQQVGPEHLLLGLLWDAEDPVETEPYPQERRLRGQVACPTTVPTRSSCWSRRGD